MKYKTIGVHPSTMDLIEEALKKTNSNNSRPNIRKMDLIHQWAERAVNELSQSSKGSPKMEK